MQDKREKGNDHPGDLFVETHGFKRRHRSSDWKVDWVAAWSEVVFEVPSATTEFADTVLHHLTELFEGSVTRGIATGCREYMQHRV